MRCLICDSTDKWKNVDEFRLKPAGMEMCEGCGFISYPSRWKSKEDIIAYYRKEYRNPPNSNNFYSGQRKLHFHAAFLKDLFDKWHSEDKAPVFFESGAAYGLALQWLKNEFPSGQVYGSELTTSYRRVAKHDFGIDLQEDFDPSRKYDLIMSYKVAEHQLDVDQELKRFREALADDGFLYISVPIWFDTLNNFGAAGFDLEYYYDPNHINVWTRIHFEQLLRKCGFEIIKQDHVIYDSTYLCKKTALPELNTVPDMKDMVLEKLKAVKEAFIHYSDGNMKPAIAAYPNFPNAHVTLAEMSRKECHEKGWQWTMENIIEPFKKACPYAADVYLLAGDFALRFGRAEDCLKYADETLRMKPENPGALLQVINALREIAIRSTDEEQKTHYFSEARKVARHLGQVSHQHTRESLDMNYLFGSHIPI